MNRNLIFISLIFLSCSSFAQQGKLSFSDFVGIGTNNPPYKLTLQGYETTGTPDRRTFLSLNNTAQTDASLVSIRLQAGSSNTVTYLTQASSIYGINNYGNEYADFGQLWNNGAGLILRAGGNAINDGIIKFQTGYAIQGSSNERMRISGNGNVGIGTRNPVAKLQVTSGDIYVEDPSKGIILRSPSGNCFRVTIDDGGNFVRTAITCPQ